MRCREKEGERNKARRLFKARNYVCIKGEEQRRALQSCGRDESLPWLFLIHANKVQYKKTAKLLNAAQTYWRLHNGINLQRCV